MKPIIVTNQKIVSTDDELRANWYYKTRTIWAICDDASKYILCLTARPRISDLKGNMGIYYDGLRDDDSWDTAMLKGIDHYELHITHGKERVDKYIPDRLDTRWDKLKSKQMYHVSDGFYHSWQFLERIDAS